MTREDIDNIISIICPNDEDFEKAIISPAYLKKELEALALEQEPATKNDLAVDCIDRQATLDAIIKRLGIKNEKYLLEAERAIYQQILAMPSVTPQLSSGLEKNSKKLEKNFGELDCINRADVNQVIEDYMDEQYHVLSDRTRERAFGAKVVMARINELPTVIPQEPTTKKNLAVDCVDRREVINQIFYSTDNSGDVVLGSALRKRIKKLPSVTPRRSKGHWIEERGDYGEILHWHCSNCYDDSGFTTTCKWHYCPECGSDNREVEDGKIKD